MTSIAVVPVQRLAVAKSRLAALLSPEERHCLVLQLLDHVLDALAGARLVDATIVVTPDPEVVERVVARGDLALRQDGAGLNEGIRLARDEAIRRSADTVLVVLGDLPLLTCDDVDALLANLGDESGVVLAPDRHQTGTNAIALCPPGILDPAFGVESLRLHRAAARAAGLTVREYHSPGTAFDVDTSEDLARLEAMGWSRAACKGRR